MCTNLPCTPDMSSFPETNARSTMVRGENGVRKGFIIMPYNYIDRELNDKTNLLNLISL
jgi:hypothetical protein